MVNTEGQTLSSVHLFAHDSHKERVRQVLLANDGKWMTLAQLSALTGIVKEGSIASRIRDLRAEGHFIDRREHKDSTRANRVYEYSYCW